MKEINKVVFRWLRMREQEKIRTVSHFMQRKNLCVVIKLFYGVMYSSSGVFPMISTKVTATAA
jgi:hypothetical protein